MTGDELTKTLLTLMFKSIATDYEDVIAMVPTSKIDSGKIHDLFKKCLESITPLGCNVVAPLVDGHSSNVKFYSTELCNGELKPHIPHPLEETRKYSFPLTALTFSSAFTTISKGEKHFHALDLMMENLSQLNFST